jgi:hypothetical protein
MAPERWLFWHRRDLRLADNRGLGGGGGGAEEGEGGGGVG